MERWTGKAVALMHLNKITQIEIANHLSVTNDYISMILRGTKTPKNAEKKILTAINEIIANRKHSNK